MSPLTPEQRIELSGIVKKMHDEGQSDDNIRAVITRYTERNVAKPAETAKPAFQPGLRDYLGVGAKAAGDVMGLPEWTTDAVIGGLKGGATTVNDVLKLGKAYSDVRGSLAGMAENVPLVGRLAALARQQAERESKAGQGLIDVVEPYTKASNTMQSVGKGVEQMAELAAPIGAADRLAIAGAEKVLPKVALKLGGKLAARSAAGAGVGAAEAEFRGGSPVAGAAFGATGPMVGKVAEMIPPAMKAGALRLGSAALGNLTSIVKHMPGSETMPEKAAKLVSFMLDKKLVSPDDAETLIDTLNDQLDAPIDAATAAGVTIDAPQRAQKVLRDAWEELRGVASEPSERIAALKARAEHLISDPEGSHAQDVFIPGQPVTKQVTKRVGNVEMPATETTMTPDVKFRELRTDMTPREGLNSARKADTNWNSGSTNPALDLDTKRMVEVAERDSIKDKVPAAAPILEDMGLAINAKKALTNEAMREAGRNVISTPAAGLTVLSKSMQGKLLGLAMQALRSGGFRSGVWVNTIANLLQKGETRAVFEILNKLGVAGAIQATGDESPGETHP